jgi:hypothetical protein
MGELEAALQALMGFLGKGTSAPGGGIGYGSAGGFGGGFANSGGGGGGMGGMNMQSILSLLTALGGGYEGMTQLKAMQRLYEEQRTNAAQAMNPAALARRTEAATLPLNRQLAYATERPVESRLAQQGMGQAPGAVASAETSAIAPYAQQNQQTGAQMAEFGFPYVQNLQVPNYLDVLKQLNSFGRESSFTAPAGTPGVGP